MLENHEKSSRGPDPRFLAGSCEGSKFPRKFENKDKIEKVESRDEVARVPFPSGQATNWWPPAVTGIQAHALRGRDCALSMEGAPDRDLDVYIPVILVL